MRLLLELEAIRTPFWDTVFSIVTRFGEETLFIAVSLVVFWCVQKRLGYYLLCVGFFGVTANQFLKLLFRVPRPWVQHETFTIVESAREGALGYSFPSGHTQSAVGMYGGIARMTRRGWLRIVCAILLFAVPFSRMYLGVHTPLDVGVSFGFALFLVFSIYPLFQGSLSRVMPVVLLAMLLAASANLRFVTTTLFASDIDAQNLAASIKNAHTIFGLAVGFAVAYPVERRYVRFSETAPWQFQVFKVVLGILGVLFIKAGLKEPLLYLVSGNPYAHSLRYALVVIFAVDVWPLTFRFASYPHKNRP